tara:strand:- start:99 stop:926 length:828 start_codon:yes stop_codon:yes gene_type:complete
MSQFDDLVAKYRNLNYGTLQGQNPSSVNSLLDDYNDRKFFTTHSDGMGNMFVRDEFGRLQFSTPEMGLLSDGTGYATYDPYFDYGDPGYAAAFQPNENYLVDAQTVRPMRGGNGQNNRDRIAAMRERSEMVDALDRFNMLPGYEEATLPGLLGLFESVIDNMDRDQQINNIMRDIDASKDFGQNKYGLDTSYKGSAGTDPSKGATPDTGPSGDDSALGKSGGSGYNNPSGNPFGGASIGGGTSGGAGTAGGHGAGQAGGAMGGDNPGNTGGTSRF